MMAHTHSHSGNEDSQNNCDDTNGANRANANSPTEAVSGTGEQTQTNNNGTQASTSSSENLTIPASAVEPAPTSVKCRLCPHGIYAVFPALFATMAWFACLSKDGCDYARVTGPIVAEITNNPKIPWIDAGFNHYREPKYENLEWSLDLSLPCQPYNSDIVNIDGVWTFAKITSFVSLVLGGGGALFIWLSLFFEMKKSTWRWAGYEMMVAIILLALTYSWFATSLCRGNNGQDKCVMEYGAKIDIVACVFWTVAALFILCKYPDEKIKKESDQLMQQSTAQVELSDQSAARNVGIATDEHEII